MGTFTGPLLHAKHLHWIKLNQYKPAGNGSMGTAFMSKWEIICQELCSSWRPCSPGQHRLMGEGQKPTALVVTTLAMHDASTAAGLHTTPLPDPSNIHHHPWQQSTEPDATALADENLSAGAGCPDKGLCISQSAWSTCWTTASLPSVCFVCRSAFTILESFLQLFFPQLKWN